MAKIVLTINANNKATESVKLLNAEVQTLSKTLSTIKVKKDLTTQINALTKHYKAVADAQAKIIANKNKEAIVDEKLRLAEARTATQIAKENTELERQNKIKAQTESITNRTARAKEKDAQSIKLTISQTQKLVKQYADLLNQINALEKSYKRGTFDKLKNDISSYFNDVKGLDDSLKSGAITQEDYNSKIIQATASLQGFKTEMATTRTESKNLHGTIKDIVSGFFNFQLGAMLVMKPLQLIRSALSSINDTLVKTEDSVISLQRVLPSGSASDGEISSRLYKIAADYGQTFENVSQIATNFARTGMSWADTIKATEAAVLALNVAELDAEEATTGLVAILSQFGLKASDLETVIDKLNKTADNFPVTTEKILAALQRTGSAADNANLSLDQTIALITALSKATGRSGENIGTALNSLIQYSSKASALDVFAGLSDNTANVVADYRKGAKNILEVWQAVSAEIKNLNAEQADLLDSYFATEDGNALKEALDGELEDIYTELGGVYDTANTFRKNYFIALLGNMDTVEQAIGTLGNAGGYSQAENQKYLDTYTAKVNKLKAQWEDIANSEQGLLGIKKALVDIGSVTLWLVKNTGGLRTTLFAFGTMAVALFGTKLYAALAKAGGAFKTFFTNLIAGFKAGASAASMFQAALGWIGLIATAASALVGVFQRVAESRKEAEAQSRADAISNWDNVENDAKSLINLYNRFEDLSGAVNRTAEEEKDWLSIQGDIIDKLGDKALILKTLTEGTQEYIDKLRELTKEEIEDNAKTARAAANATSTFSGGVSEYLYTKPKPLSSQNKEKINAFDFYIDDKTKDYLLQNGFTLTDKNNVGDLVFAEKNQWDVYRNRVVSSGDFFKDYQRLTDISDTLFKSEDFNRSADYTSVQNALKVLYDNLKTQVVNETAAQYYEFRLNNDFQDISTQAQFNEIVNNIMTATGATEEFKDEIVAALLALTKFNKEEQKADDFWSNNIKDVTGKYDDLISKLEELRDLQKESTEWEEKKLAVLEAEQALENARNEATVRRFNQATGQWEWQTDEKAIKEAEDNLDKARLDLEEAAYDNIIKQLEEQTATNDSILAILKEVAPLLGEDFSNAVQNAIKDKTGVDISQPIISKEKSYDSGGVANGLGVMVKATAQPESVNNPELTRKILSPVSNAEFNRYVRDMGIMFERSHQYAQAPIIERVGGAVDNRVNNSGQVIMNGVAIGSDKRGNSLDEILSLASIVPNV